MDDNHWDEDEDDDVGDMDKHSQGLGDDLNGQTLFYQQADEDGDQGV